MEKSPTALKDYFHSVIHCIQLQAYTGRGTEIPGQLLTWTCNMRFLSPQPSEPRPTAYPWEHLSLEARSFTPKGQSWNFLHTITG